MLSLHAISVPPKSSSFDLVGLIEAKLGKVLKDGDVLVISSKFIATSEGRVVSLDTVTPGREAKRIATRYRMDPRLCELVLRESDQMLGGIPGFLLTIKDGLITPNAGIDKSNAKHGNVVLYPRRAEESAWKIREALRFSHGVNVGIVVCDSRLAPTRRGTTGVAVAASGLQAVVDFRGKRDLFGNVLKVTSQAVADDLSSAAELLMGESDEGIPIVLVRGLSRRLLKNIEYPPRKFAIAADEDVYLRSLADRWQIS